jgi:predicted RNA methylase
VDEVAGFQKPPRIPLGGSQLSTVRVTAAIKQLQAPSRRATLANWFAAVSRLVTGMRPDLAAQLSAHLGAEPSDENPLDGLSIGDIGVVYEALLALTDHRDRREKGQYFTPDDVAAFLAGEAAKFPAGRWLDPCCGVGNLAFHLAAVLPDPAAFVAERLSLVDLDAAALRTAIALLVANFAADGDLDALPALAARSRSHDFLTLRDLPAHDYVIVNPPYARTAQLADRRWATARAGELYAYFLERVAKARGFVAITPASHLGGAKYAPVRDILWSLPGGEVIVFDNVPDTCFRGFKYGSTNTSTTNFVRAAITVSSPAHEGWTITPILRWAVRSRVRMFHGARTKLVPLRRAPGGEWAKVMPGTEGVWDLLVDPAATTLRDLVSAEPTEYVLEIAATPRYYVSATKRSLDRGSKHVLWFRTQADLDRAYLVLNSSLPYWWWRCLDGGVTLQARTLLSLPLPAPVTPSADLLARLEASEASDLVTKLNAGRENENVRRPRSLVDEIDTLLLAGIAYDFTDVYASDLFAIDAVKE